MKHERLDNGYVCTYWIAGNQLIMTAYRAEKGTSVNITHSPTPPSPEVLWQQFISDVRRLK